MYQLDVEVIETSNICPRYLDLEVDVVKFHYHYIVVSVNRIGRPHVFDALRPLCFFGVLGWIFVVDAVSFQNFLSIVVVSMHGMGMARATDVPPAVPLFLAVFELGAELVSRPREPVFVGQVRTVTPVLVDVAVCGLGAPGEQLQSFLIGVVLAHLNTLLRTILEVPEEAIEFIELGFVIRYAYCIFELFI